jgi:hypothetical protein
VAGDFKVVATSDLKGLGAKEGSPVMYSWTMPSLMPLLVPWILLVVLLALRPNRCGRAWWILLPLGIWAGIGTGLETTSTSDAIPGAFLESFLPLLSAAAFGFAAVFLLGFLLAGKPWPLVFLGMCAAQTLFSLAALAAGADADSWPAQLGMSVVLAVCGVGTMLALALAGLFSRRRYSALKLSAWVLVWLLAGWLLLSLPFCLIGALSDSFVPWPALLLGCAVIAAVCFLAILPFLILCSANSFYRDRFQAMLGIPAKAPPPPSIPGITPTPQAA